jgi:hypothetical protein
METAGLTDKQLIANGANIYRIGGGIEIAKI